MAHIFKILAASEFLSNMLFNYHLLYFCTALSLKIITFTLSQLTQCPFTGTLHLLFMGYEYHLDTALVKPTQERWLKLHPTSQVKTCFDGKMFDVANWVACLNRENGSGGTPSHEALSVSPQGALEISSVA